ncbi:hypothetical protein NKH34_21000 [Mesorhizobium sp. M1148]
MCLVRGDAVEDQDYDLEKPTWLWKITTDEDKKIIEHTARGVRSHYFVPGPITPMEYNELRYIGWYLVGGEGGLPRVDDLLGYNPVTCTTPTRRVRPPAFWYSQSLEPSPNLG